MEFSREEVAKHNTKDDCFIIIDSKVYDVTKFKAMHPGGEGVLLKVAGKECTDEFFGLHKFEQLNKYHGKLFKGTIKGESPQITKNFPGAISEFPYAESSSFLGFKSPYYKPSHHAFRAALRKFYATEIAEEAVRFEQSGKAPSKEVYLKMGEFGVLASRIGPGKHLKFVPNLPANVKPEEFDYFHELIAHEENTLLPATPGYADGLGAGMVIGLPPVLAFGSKEMVGKVVPEVLSGNKRICLAISEPTAGSDVANIECTAVLSADRTHYIVNGIKKWITGGHASDYFTTAVRTGGPGMNGLSMLLIERGEGVETKPIKTSYAASAGTCLVIYEDVKVPVANLIGREGSGFQVIMFNFNHERWLIVVAIVRASRGVIEECFKWANQRKVFGKKLIEQAVIRWKLANMIAQLESVQNWLENITFQMTQMSYKEQSIKLAGPIALLKLQSTRMAHYVSDEACQIMGGRGITKTGMGNLVEAFQRTYKFAAILGGSEEIMADLGVRMAMKQIPNDAKL